MIRFSQNGRIRNKKWCKNLDVYEVIRWAGHRIERGRAQKSRWRVYCWLQLSWDYFWQRNAFWLAFLLEFFFELSLSCIELSFSAIELSLWIRRKTKIQCQNVKVQRQKVKVQKMILTKKQARERFFTRKMLPESQLNCNRQYIQLNIIVIGHQWCPFGFVVFVEWNSFRPFSRLFWIWRSPALKTWIRCTSHSPHPPGHVDSLVFNVATTTSDAKYITCLSKLLISSSEK